MLMLLFKSNGYHLKWHKSTESVVFNLTEGS